MSTSRVMKWISGGLEALLGIPFVGGLIVVSLFWIPLAVALGLHITTLLICRKEETNIHGSVLGIITSCLAWIPFLGMVMHIVTAILLMVDATKPNEAKVNIEA